MRNKSVLFSLLAAGGIGILASQGVDVMDSARADDKLDYKEARELRQQGEILSLQEILKRVEKDHPGQVIETELERESGRYIYELEIVTEQGKVIEIEVDAGTGETLKVEEEE